MGFWNVKAKDLRQGDEIRVRVMGGEEYLTVKRVRATLEGIRLEAEWGWHVPNAAPVLDTLPPDETLTVRR